jgi:hypothetical protein
VIVNIENITISIFHLLLLASSLVGGWLLLGGEKNVLKSRKTQKHKNAKALSFIIDFKSENVELN